MFRFTIRDVLWLTVVVALGVAWLTESRRATRLDEYRRLSEPQVVEWKHRAHAGRAMLEHHGWKVVWDDMSIDIHKPGERVVWQE